MTSMGIRATMTVPKTETQKKTEALWYRLYCELHPETQNTENKDESSEPSKLTRVPHIVYEIFQNLLFSDLEKYGKLRETNNFCRALQIDKVVESAVMVNQLEQMLECTSN